MVPTHRRGLVLLAFARPGDRLGLPRTRLTVATRVIEDFDTGEGSSLSSSGGANGFSIGRRPDDGGGEIGDGSASGRAGEVRRSLRIAAAARRNPPGGDETSGPSAAQNRNPQGSPRGRRANTPRAVTAQPETDAKVPRDRAPQGKIPTEGMLGNVLEQTLLDEGLRDEEMAKISHTRISTGFQEKASLLRASLTQKGVSSN
ncbi:hypothetical protein B0H19DRAFT_1077837 [Mycena capillaripes]|nr:hypothetical protein B0H19DRAFT_1077837 [Mycena capillaripes]